MASRIENSTLDFEQQKFFLLLTLLSLPNIQSLQKQEFSHWKRKDLYFSSKEQELVGQMNRQNEEILKIIEKSEIEKLNQMVDQYPCLRIRKFALKSRLLIVLLSSKIVKFPLFEYFFLIVILSNSVILALDDPQDNTTTSWRLNLDNFFSVLYLFEFFLKIFGNGFVFNKGAYLRDYWNLLDFFVVLQIMVQYLLETSVRLSALRAFRILRPLRTITSIEGLKLLVSALISAFPLLRDTIIILIFFFFIFAIGGLQILSGYLLNRCFHIYTGLPHNDDLLCGSSNSCPPDFICGQRMSNPNLGITSFDSVFYSLLTIFQCITLEGWSGVMLYLMKTAHYLVFMLFMPLVFIGAYFLLNLTLAVISYKFTEVHKHYLEKRRLEVYQKLRQDNQNAENLKVANFNNDDGYTSDRDEKKKNKANLALSIRQYVSAKKAARKMKDFLHSRQKIRQKQRIFQNFKTIILRIMSCRICQNIFHRQSPKTVSMKAIDFLNLQRKQENLQFEKKDLNKYSIDQDELGKRNSQIFNQGDEFISKIKILQSSFDVQNQSLTSQNQVNQQSPFQKTQFDTSQKKHKNKVNFKSIFHQKQKSSIFAQEQSISFSDRSKQSKQEKLDRNRDAIVVETRSQNQLSPFLFERNEICEDTSNPDAIRDIIHELSIKRPATQNTLHRRRNLNQKQEYSRSTANINDHSGAIDSGLKYIKSNLEIQDIKSQRKIKPKSKASKQIMKKTLNNPFMNENHEPRNQINFYQMESQNQDQSVSNLQHQRQFDQDIIFEQSSDDFEIMRVDNAIHLTSNSQTQIQQPSQNDDSIVIENVSNQFVSSLSDSKMHLRRSKRSLSPSQNNFNERRMVISFNVQRSSISSRLKSSEHSQTVIHLEDSYEHHRKNSMARQNNNQIFLQNQDESGRTFQKLRLAKNTSQNPFLLHGANLDNQNSEQDESQNNLKSFENTLNLSQHQLLLFDVSQTSLSGNELQQYHQNQQALKPKIYKRELQSQSLMRNPMLMQMTMHDRGLEGELLEQNIQKTNSSQSISGIETQQEFLQESYEEGELIYKDNQKDKENNNPTKISADNNDELRMGSVPNRQQPLVRRQTGYIIRELDSQGHVIREKESTDKTQFNMIIDDMRISPKVHGGYKKNKRQHKAFYEHLLGSNRIMSLIKQKLSLSHILSKTQKVVLNQMKPEYFSSSQADILEPRLKKVSKYPHTNFMKAEEGVVEDEDFPDPSRFRPQRLRPLCKPHQLRVIYLVKEDPVTNELINRLIEREEFRHLQQQPYETLASIAYKKFYDNDFIKGATKLCELYYTSTLSFTIIPKDKSKGSSISKDTVCQAQFFENKVKFGGIYDYQVIIPKQKEKIIATEDEIILSASSFTSQSNRSCNNKNNLQQVQNIMNSQISEQESFSSSENDQPEEEKQTHEENMHSNNRRDNRISEYQIAIKRVSQQESQSMTQNENVYSLPFMQKHITIVPNQQYQSQKDDDYFLNQTLDMEYLKVPQQSVKVPDIMSKKSTFLFNHQLSMHSQKKESTSTKEQDQNHGKVKTLVEQAMQIHGIRSKVSQKNISFDVIKFQKQQTAPSILKRQRNTFKEQQKQKEKMEQLNLLNIQDFFEGNYFSSDDEELRKKKSITTNFSSKFLKRRYSNEFALLNEENLEKLNSQNGQNDKVIISSIHHVVNNKDKTTNQEQKREKEVWEAEELSDVPTSLQSDYEDIKIVRKNMVADNNHSKKFTSIINSIQKFSQQNYIDFQLLRSKDIKQKKFYSRWSGQDVLNFSLSDQKAKEVVFILNKIRVWPQGYSFLKSQKNLVKDLTQSSLFENFMTICVIINTIVLSLDRHNIDAETEKICTYFNLVFTYVFCLELLLKVWGLGIRKYFRDNMNFLDTGVVALSLIELIINSIQSENQGSHGISKGSLTAFRAVRIFRTFRVLRVARLLRQLRSMQIIIGVIQRSIKSFIYIAGLLMLFIYIYALLGMTLFGDMRKYSVGANLANGNHGPLSRSDFANFNNSFITVFTILTLENWNYIMYDTMYFSNQNQSVVALYFISWIFIGNFILLNLFLAILLESFLVEEEEEEEQIEKESSKIQQLESQSRSQRLKSKFQKKETKQVSAVELRRQTDKPFFDLIHMLQSQKTQEKIHGTFHLIHQSKPSPLQNNKATSVVSKTENILSLFGFGKQNQQDSIPKYFEELEQEDKMRLIIKFGIAQNQKKLKRKTTKADIFRDIQCNNSLYIFEKTNRIRVNLLRVAKHRFFEKFILTIIIVSSIKLAIDTYYIHDPETTQMLSKLDIIFTTAFLAEALIKVIAYGFIIDKGSYLRESWNILDFFIVASSIFDLVLDSINIPAFKILRLLRTLRPLRFITHNTAMKVLVVALFESVGSILNVIIVILIAWLMFAILGISFFSGKFNYCSVDKYSNSTEMECLRNKGEWLRYGSNFDDIVHAMLTLYVVTSLQNWPDIMYQAIDSTQPDQGPKQNNFTLYGYYFVGFILIGTFFFLNFFLGVLFLNFKIAQKKITNQDQTQIKILLQERDEASLSKQDYDKLHLWKDIQVMIINSSPDYETTNIPKDKWRKILHKFVSSKVFEVFILLCVILNTASLACFYNGSSQDYQTLLDNINIFFSAVFAFEAIMKIVAYRVSYFENYLNLFDLGIVISSLMEIFINIVAENRYKIIRTAPQIVRILRVLRVTRIIKLMGKYKGLQALISTIMFSLPPLFNVFSLLLIIFFIFAVLGVFLFNDIIQGDVIDDQYINFSNFGLAMLMLFKISTGEDWNYVMYDTMNQDNCRMHSDCTSSFAPFYFICFVLICSYVMLNLFVLVILQQFNKYYLPSDNVISRFKSDLQNFKEIWQKFSMERYNCQKIKDTQIISFMTSLKEPLGFSSPLDDMEISKELLSLGIRVENDGYVYFNEMLYRCMRRVYGYMKLNQELQVFELKTQISIQKQTLMKVDGVKYSFFDRKYERAAVIAIMQEKRIFNPLVQKFYSRLAFNTWLRQSRVSEMKSKRSEERVVEIEYDSDEEVLIPDFSLLDNLDQDQIKQESIQQNSDINNKDDMKQIQNKFEEIFGVKQTILKLKQKPYRSEMQLPKIIESIESLQDGSDTSQGKNNLIQKNKKLIPLPKQSAYVISFAKAHDLI